MQNTSKKRCRPSVPSDGFRMMCLQALAAFVLYMGPQPLVDDPSMCDEASSIRTTTGPGCIGPTSFTICSAGARQAYSQVNAASFVGHKMWRHELLREQRAYCLLRAGQRAEALAAFIDVIERRERAFDRGEDSLLSPVLMEPPFLLVEAAKGPLRAELFERVAVVGRYELPFLVKELEDTEH